MKAAAFPPLRDPPRQGAGWGWAASASGSSAGPAPGVETQTSCDIPGKRGLRPLSSHIGGSWCSLDVFILLNTSLRSRWASSVSAELILGPKVIRNK